MRDSTRRFFCASASCRAEVFICTSCDRNQRYCAGGCARTARTRSVAESKHRYASSIRGRLKHAERSQRYRDQRKSVTDHSSLSAADHDVLDTSAASAAITPSCDEETATTPVTDASAIAVPTTEGMSCSFCRRRCGPWIRHAPLRRRLARF
jgi:hypothetical protein